MQYKPHSRSSDTSMVRAWQGFALGRKDAVTHADKTRGRGPPRNYGKFTTRIPGPENLSWVQYSVGKDTSVVVRPDLKRAVVRKTNIVCGPEPVMGEKIFDGVGRNQQCNFGDLLTQSDYNHH